MRWWERFGAWADAHRFLMDAVGTLVLALIVVPISAGVMGVENRGVLRLWSLALVAPLAWRRVAPTASAAAVYTIALAQFPAGIQLVFPADLVVLVALYSVTVHGPVWAYRTAAVGGIAGAALFGAQMLLSYGSLGDASFWSLLIALMCLSVFGFGLVRRSRREAIATLVDRAERLEVERDQQTQIATAAERARIAREMHDIVAHSLSVIIAQADGGRYAAGQDPAAAERSLGTIAETGRAALADMRRLLGVLRPGGTTPRATEPTASTGGTRVVGAPAAGAGPVPSKPGTVAAPVADLLPQPAVEDVATLVAQVRDAGVRVSLVRMGTPRTLPPGTGLTVFRICQESLTNILKHAGPAPTATVLLQWTAASLVLEVTDDGRGASAASDGSGQGILGMRERAAMLGGTLTAGPRPGGGFRVRTEIPIPPLTRPEAP